MKNKIKNKNLLLLTLATSITLPSMVLSCSNTDNSNNETNPDEKIFNEAFSSFDIKLKSGSNISDVLSSSIKTEENLLQYFDLLNKNESVTYTFSSATSSGSSKTNLDVIYKISYKTFTKEKPFTLTGFKAESSSEDDQKLFNQAYESFNIKTKANIDLSLIETSSITNETSLLNYFDLLSKNENVTYTFVSATPNASNKTQLNVEYKISYKEFTKNKSFTLTGFKAEQTPEEQKTFDEAFNSFNIVKKSDSTIDNMFTGYISSEKDLLQYFELQNKQTNIEYTFVSAKPDDSQDNLIVKYRIKNKDNVKIKSITLTGFKKPTTEDEKTFNEVFGLFVVTNKKDISKVEASSITSESELLKYFDWDEIAGYTITFQSASVDSENKSKLNVAFEIKSDENESLKHKKTITLSGFLNPDAKPITPEEQKIENQKILNEILYLLEITSIKSHADMSARDFVFNYVKDDLFTTYFSFNKDDMYSLYPNDVQIPAQPSVKRDPTNYDNVIFTIEISVGKVNERIIGNKEIVIQGFKSLIGELDKPGSSISMPSNAVSYKGVLEPILFRKMSINNYKDKINQFTFEQYKVELMYQLRFWMYQMFEDNFSDLNYWIEGGKNEKDPLVAKIEGIVKENADGLYFYVQQLGNGNGLAKTQNLVKGQKITITLRRDNVDEWRPLGAGSFGLLPEERGFSFIKGCKNISSANRDKTAYGSSLGHSGSRAILDISINGSSVISQSSWSNFGTVMFTIGGNGNTLNK